MSEKVVIVGGGLAAASAAQSLRQCDFSGSITIIDDEKYPPYERPGLSKAYLRHEVNSGDLYCQTSEFWSQNNIDLMLDCRAEAIDKEQQTITLKNGSTITYDKLILATGAIPRHLRDDYYLDDVYYLRTVDDASRLRQHLTKRDCRLLVVGGGWIGCEVAASAKHYASKVTMVMPESYPLEKVLGSEIGRFYRDLHQSNGVEIINNQLIDTVDQNKKVVVSDKGQEIEYDLIVVGIGVLPDDRLARQSGLETKNGILTNARFQTSDSNIFAIGDAASVYHPIYKKNLRVEHWFNAREQGRWVGPALMGEEIEYTEAPYFFSDQYDTAMEYSGYCDNWDEVVIRGNTSDKKFEAFWLVNGHIEAVMSVNCPTDEHEKIRKLLGSQFDHVVNRQFVEAGVGAHV